MQIIDVHTHAFPDFLAEKAITALQEHSHPYKAQTDGTVDGLLSSMQEAGITRAFIANIATKAEQAPAIIKWSKEIKSETIIPLGSFLPANPNWEKDIKNIADADLPGIKLHPLYQAFNIDDKEMYPMYEYMAQLNLFILFHAGYDIAFDKERNASPDKIKKIKREFPQLKIIAAHVGGWKDWESVLEILTGENIYFDLSFIDELTEETRKAILNKHDTNLLLFGTDAPWKNQKEMVDYVTSLPLHESQLDKIFYKNALELLKE